MKGEAMALGSALCWAVAVILFRRSPALSPFAINLFKNVFALLLFGLTLLVTGGGLGERPPGEWAQLGLSGVLGIAVADTLFFAALQRLGPARLAIVECAYAPSVVLLSVLFLSEPLGLSLALGAALVAAGVAVGSLERAPQGEVDRRGVALGVTAILSLGAGVLLAKPVLAHSGLVEVTTVRLLAGVGGQLLYAAFHRRPRQDFAAFWQRETWSTLIPASILSTWLAMLLWLGGFKYTAVSVAAVLNQTTTAWVLVLARVVLGEALTPRRLGGAALAVSGALLILLTRP